MPTAATTLRCVQSPTLKRDSRCDSRARHPCSETSGARCPSEIRIWPFIECYCVSQLYTIQQHPPHTPCLQEDSGAAPRGIACIQISAAKCMNIHTVWGKRTINSLYPSHQFKSGFATRSTRKMTLVCKAFLKLRL